MGPDLADPQEEKKLREQQLWIFPEPTTIISIRLQKTKERES